MSGKKRNPVAGITVYQRGRKWWYRLELERHPLTDERQYEYQGGFAIDAEAWAEAIKAKAAHEQGRRVGPSKITVAEFFDEWLDTIRDSVKPSTHVNYADYRNAYVVPFIGRKRLQKVDVPVLNAMPCRRA
jgi:hypothetical protein